MQNKIIFKSETEKCSLNASRSLLIVLGVIHLLPHYKIKSSINSMHIFFYKEVSQSWS